MSSKEESKPTTRTAIAREAKVPERKLRAAAPMRNIFCVLTVRARAPVCPDSDPNVRAIRQDINKSIETLQKQVELLAQRLLRSQVQLNELRQKPESTEKLPIRVRRYRLILIRWLAAPGLAPQLGEDRYCTVSVAVLVDENHFDRFRLDTGHSVPTFSRPPRGAVGFVGRGHESSCTVPLLNCRPPSRALSHAIKRPLVEIIRSQAL